VKKDRQSNKQQSRLLICILHIVCSIQPKINNRMAKTGAERLEKKTTVTPSDQIKLLGFRGALLVVIVVVIT